MQPKAAHARLFLPISEQHLFSSFARFAVKKVHQHTFFIHASLRLAV